MRPHESLARLMGFDIFRIKRSHITVKRHLKTLFDFMGVNIVIDVGANEGQYGMMLRKAGYKGKIFSFEPVSSTYEKLSMNSHKDDKWVIRQCALGSKPEKLEINVTQYSDMASFHKPNEFAKEIFPENVKIDKTEQVDVVTLDSLFGEITANEENPVVFLKMDTQGHDLEVFNGANNSIKSIAGLQSEVSVIKIYEGIPDYIESISEFRKQGFEITGLYPVTRDGRTLSIIEFDCVMTRINQ